MLKTKLLGMFAFVLVATVASGCSSGSDQDDDTDDGALSGAEDGSGAATVKRWECRVTGCSGANCSGNAIIEISGGMDATELTFQEVERPANLGDPYTRRPSAPLKTFTAMGKDGYEPRVTRRFQFENDYFDVSIAMLKNTIDVPRQGRIRSYFGASGKRVFEGSQWVRDSPPPGKQGTQWFNCYDNAD